MEEKYIYSTKELSNFYDLTSKGLAYYEEQGILHPKRKKDSTYRIFTLEDCYSLYHSKMYKNSGLSLKEMAKLEKDGSLDDTIQALKRVSEEELERIRIEKRIQDRVLEITNILEEYSQKGTYYKVVDRPECYRLYVRNYDFHHVSNEKSAEEFAKWNSYIPINTASLLYTKEKLLSNDDVMNVNIANIISADDFKFLKLEKTDSVTYYPSCKCVETIISGSAVEIDTKKWLEEPLSYLEKQGYKLADDVLTSMLLVTNVDNQKIRYDIAWLPIK